MNYLAMDTTHDRLTACAKIDGELRLYEDAGSRRHSTTLMPAVDELLGNRKDALDFIAVNAGPGSFTGIRIGVTTAKVLAWVLQIPVVSFTSTELLAYKIPGDRVAVVDGGNRICYTERFGPRAEALCQRTEAELEDYLRALPKDVTVVGAVGTLAGDRSAAQIAALAETKFAAGKTTDCKALEPVYVQLSQAEKDLK